MAIRSNAGLSGSVPQMNHQPEGSGTKALFHSVRDIALILSKTLQGGYGVLKAGTILAEGNVSKLLVPYIGSAAVDTDNVGRSSVIENVPNGTTCKITIADSYKFQVGDNLMLVRNNSGTPVYHAGGAITAIDNTTSKVFATVTFTTTTGGTSFTVVAGTAVYVAAGTSTRFSTAKYILDKDVDTGSGEDTRAMGANTSVVISNAVLYSTSLVNCDTTAVSALGVEDGRFLILK